MFPSDAARTPHGDSNFFQTGLLLFYPMVDAARTPHGDRNCIQSPQIRLTVFDAARPPHGDSNLLGNLSTM